MMDANNSIAVPWMRDDRAICDDERVMTNILQLDSQFLPSDSYFNTVQTDIKPKMRRILLHWMLEVLDEQKCDRDIFSLAVNYVDRFLSATCISRDDLQLVGTAAMFIASKLREPRPLAADTLVMYTDNSIELRQLMMMEIMLVSTLKWDVASVTPFDVLVQILSRLPLAAAVRSRLQAAAYVVLTRFALTIEYLRYPPTKIAACALLTAIEVVHDDDDESISNRTFCTGCAQLGLRNDYRDCQFDKFHKHLLLSTCQLLHLSKEEIAECHCILQEAIMAESEESDLAEEASDNACNLEKGPAKAQSTEVPVAASLSHSVPRPEPQTQTQSQSQTEQRARVVINRVEDEDSLMSQCDVEMGGLLEVNNNEPGHRLMSGKSLDDSGFASDLSPPTRRYAASTPNDNVASSQCQSLISS